MLKIRSFRVDGMLPPGLVLNTRLSDVVGDETYYPVIAPVYGGVEFNDRYVEISQANASTAYRLIGRLLSPALVGRAGGSGILEDYDDGYSSAPPVQVNLFHDPCILLNAPYFSGVVEVLSGDDLPITLFDGQVTPTQAYFMKSGAAEEAGVVSIPSEIIFPSRQPQTLIGVKTSEVAVADTSVSLAKKAEDALSVYGDCDALTSAVVMSPNGLFSPTGHGMQALTMRNEANSKVRGLPMKTVYDHFGYPVFLIPNPQTSTRVLVPDATNYRAYDLPDDGINLLLGWDNSKPLRFAVLARLSQDLDLTWQV